MTNLMTESFVQQAVNSNEQFPVNFDDAWQGLGYTRKDNALANLVDWFEKGYDYHLLQKEEMVKRAQGGGARRNKYFLTTDVYKEFCMMSRTEKGREVRKYFIEVEKKYRESLNRLLTQPAQQPLPTFTAYDEVVSYEEVQEALNVYCETLDQYYDLKKETDKLAAKIKVLKLQRDNYYDQLQSIQADKGVDK